MRTIGESHVRMNQLFSSPMFSTVPQLMSVGDEYDQLFEIIFTNLSCLVSLYKFNAEMKLHCCKYKINLW